jgi:hypothetical protein
MNCLGGKIMDLKEAILIMIAAVANSFPDHNIVP